MNAELFSYKCKEVFDLGALELSDSYYYASLPLCVVDAVFSIGVKYTSVKNVVTRYCEYFNLRKFAKEQKNRQNNHTMSDFIANIELCGIDKSADHVFCNHQRTSSKSGILKVDAALQFAKILRENGIETFDDLNKKEISKNAEEKILKIPGQSSGLSLRYFYMLSGDDSLAKPDRHVLKFINQQIGDTVSVSQAQELLSKTILLLKDEYPNLTVRLLDHAIWNHMAHKAKNENIK